MPLLAVTCLIYVYMWIFFSVLTVYTRMWKGPSEWRLCRVGLPLLYCTLLPAWVDGFTRQLFLRGCSVVVLRIPLRGRVVLWSRRHRHKTL
jgi:hypothetical protein